jgi:SAM-dependent methyltransferase
VRLVSRMKRARVLYRQRGLKWLIVAALGEIPLLPRLFSLMANLAYAITPTPFVALAGVHSNQLWPERRDALQRVARQFLNKPCDALEIGSWMARGSTQIWMSMLAPGSSLLIVDAWRPYFAAGEIDKAASQINSLQHVALNVALKEIYKRESRQGLSISLVRAKSSAFLPLLKEKSFDLIYIDGSHYYADAKRDMQEAKRLIRAGGLICGDDLDFPANEELIRLARENIAIDLLILPDGHAIHPGVLLAVTEEFQSVHCEHGFWWVEPKVDRNSGKNPVG